MRDLYFQNRNVVIKPVTHLILINLTNLVHGQHEHHKWRTLRALLVQLPEIVDHGINCESSFKSTGYLSDGVHIDAEIRY